MTCPRCGTPDAAGKFCHNCGAALSGARCAHCGTALTAGARFCHVCATPVSGAAARGAPAWFPWVIAASVAALLVIGGLLVSGRDAPPAAPAGRAPGGAVDISQMTPRQRADALFDRVMRLDAAGQTDSVMFFASMAIQAHAMMGPLDNDARYHLGLIHLAAGNPAAARAQGDSILLDTPTHLFGFLLQAQGAAAMGDQAAAQRANRAFLQHYDAELAAERVEYQGHPTPLATHRDSLQR